MELCKSATLSCGIRSRFDTAYSNCRTGKDQSGSKSSQEVINHADHQPRSQEAEPSADLAIGRRHNAALPIHNLPAEVLLQIFRLHMLELGNLSKYYTPLLSLSRVCSHWYNLIRDSPPLWTRVSLSDPPSLVETALQRSSCHQVDIVIYVGPPKNPLEFQTFMHSISLHRDRWRRMDIRVPYPYVEGIVEALGVAPPNLEKLIFKDRDTVSCSNNYDLFRGKAPRLSKLTLNGVSIRWDSEVLHNLTFLDISWVHFSSTNAILRALSHSPQLQRLTIAVCSTGSMATPSSHFVQLSQLVWIHVDLRDEVATENLLEHIISDAKDAP